MLANHGGRLSDAAMFGVGALATGVIVASAAVLPLAGGFVAAWAGRKRTEPAAAGSAR
ncbi:MAG TPA: hypothetical protein VI011_15235 [Asanoa sp.]